MNDPSSYQFVSIKDWGDFTYKDRLDRLAMEYSAGRLDEYYTNREISEWSDDDEINEMVEAKSRIEGGKAVLMKRDSIEKSFGGKIDTPVLHNYVLTFRAKNMFAALMLMECVVQVQPQGLEVINIAATPKEVILDYGHIPNEEDIRMVFEDAYNRPNQNVKRYADSLNSVLKVKKRIRDSDAIPGEQSQNVVPTLDLVGWQWDRAPQPVAPEDELPGRIVFLIEVDENGELVRYRKQSGTVSAAAERSCVEAIQKLTFAKKPGVHVPAVTRGRITFEVGVNVTSSQAIFFEEAREDKIYMVVEQQPEYPGGYEAMMNFVRKNMEYPAGARQKGTEGTVYISFVVRPDGSIDDISVLRGISPECDQEAIRVIRAMPNWTAGRQSGEPVSVRFNLPIRFKL